MDYGSDLSHVQQETEESNIHSDGKLYDPNNTIDFSRKLVRIQYPGIVKNIDKALETLGGIHNIEKVVSNHRTSLDLHFHPANKYSKPCFSDRDFDAGILLKVKMKIPKNENSDSNNDHPQRPIYEYSLIGVTAQNLTFNRLCDFQYLPLMPKVLPETKESEVENIYRKIVPDRIPELSFLNAEESRNMPLHFTPAAYARFDTSNTRLFLGTGERFESAYRPEIAKAFTNQKTDRVHAKPFSKKHHFSLTINYKGGKVPEKTPDYIIQLVKDRALEDVYQKVFKLFEERPIWTRAAIMYSAKLTFEHSKTILPAVAYYVRRGPWRSTWIRFGYDPKKDPKSRIYQTLDYRIRTAEGSKQKIALKRKALSHSSQFDGPATLQKISLQEDLLKKKKQEVDEKCYILTPDTLPPARQLFYQYCDLKLPEIEAMLSRLPQPTPHVKPDPKNGWLPANFTEQCREIVNKYILETVKREMLREHQESSGKTPSKVPVKLEGSTSSEYCSKMLSNIRKGIYTSVPIASAPSLKSNQGGSKKEHIMEEEILDSDEDAFETTAEEHIERTIPEKLDINLLDDDDDDDDDEEDDDSSNASDDMDIDMEALEEVKQLIGIKKDSKVVSDEEVDNMNL